MKSQYLKKFKLPDAPGVYIFKHGREILYIGKATNLKDRVKSYFSSDLIKSRGMLLVDMIAKANKVDCVKTDSVLEALILEAELIKKYQPKYNTKEKDNKSFNYVCITNESIPKVLIIRGRNLHFPPTKGNMPKGRGDIYSHTFGPFTSGTQLREALKIIRRIFPFFDAQSIKKQNTEFYRQLGLVPNINIKQKRKNVALRNSHPSLEGQVLSVGSADSSEQHFSSFFSLVNYKNNIKNLILFFQGKKKKILQNLKKEMGDYAKCQDFEKANEIKKRIFALKHINDVALIKEDSMALRNQKNIALFNRIEAYDVAHLSGKNIVGVMTVVQDGGPEKSEYKKFIVKSVENSNDPASLREILERRLAHKDWAYPILIVVDGNNIQKNVAEKVLKDFNLKIPVVAVTKDERHKPKALLGSRVLIEKHKKDILLANSEAHRFALNFHKKRRSKDFLK